MIRGLFYIKRRDGEKAEGKFLKIPSTSAREKKTLELNLKLAEKMYSPREKGEGKR